MSHIQNAILPFIGFPIGIFAILLINRQAGTLFSFLGQSPDAHLLGIFFTIAFICVMSFVIFFLAKDTPLPSFVVAIMFGIAGRDLLAPVVEENLALGAIVGFGATMILFSGGLETPWENFKRLVWKILSLSFLGLFLTAALFSWVVFMLGAFFGASLSIATCILLGAVLASTDPAAIIPVLKQLRFKNRDTKDIIVSESAVTDVTGTLLTVVFLSLVSAGVLFESVGDAYAHLFNAATGMVLLRQLAYGVLLGVVGFVLLQGLAHLIGRRGEEFETDAAYFFFVPLIIFTVALALGGSGYLAAFIAGLLFVLSESMHITERFFNQMIDGFLKPTIFLLLGALADINMLIAYVGIGIAAALIFMLIIRPLAVFLTLGPFSLIGKNRLGVRELLFISFIRETGAIPAVLLVTIVGLGIPGLDGLLPIGMWVILATLILEPPLTPIAARILKVATVVRRDEELIKNIPEGVHRPHSSKSFLPA